MFEKAVILDHPIFLSVDAVNLHQGQLHFFSRGHKVILVTRGMKIVEKSKHIGIITFKGSTNFGLGLPTEDARSNDPRLVSTC